MLKLSPSLLSADFAELGGEIRAVERAGAVYAHLDVMDGQFVPNITIGPVVVKSLRRVSNLVFDVHLMIDRPERFAEAFAAAGADIVCFHLEAAAEPWELIRRIRGLGKRPAMAVKPETPVSSLLPYVKGLDMALIMSVEPGFGGQAFMPAALDKARILRNYITANRIDCDIEMDGGISLQNLRAVIDSGVNVIVAGSDIFGAEDVTARIREYLGEFNRGGLCPPGGSSDKCLER